MADEEGFEEARLQQLEKWVFKPVAGAITDAVFGAVTGVFCDLLFKTGFYVLNLQKPLYSSLGPEELCRYGGYQPLMRSFIEGSRLENARSCAVICGVTSGVSCVMKELRGKGEDVQTCMVATFGAGAMLSLVTGVRGPEVISCGAMFALLCGGLFKGYEKLSEVKSKDVSHDKTRVTFSRNHVFFTGNALSLHIDHRKEMKKRVVPLMRLGDSNEFGKFF